MMGTGKKKEAAMKDPSDNPSELLGI